MAKAILIRGITPELHKRIRVGAALAGLSMEKWLVLELEKAAPPLPAAVTPSKTRNK